MQIRCKTFFFTYSLIYTCHNVIFSPLFHVTFHFIMHVLLKNLTLFTHGFHTIFFGVSCHVQLYYVYVTEIILRYAFFFSFFFVSCVLIDLPPAEQPVSNTFSASVNPSLFNARNVAWMLRFLQWITHTDIYIDMGQCTEIVLTWWVTPINTDLYNGTIQSNIADTIEELLQGITHTDIIAFIVSLLCWWRGNYPLKKILSPLTITGSVRSPENELPYSSEKKTERKMKCLTFEEKKKEKTRYQITM